MPEVLRCDSCGYIYVAWDHQAPPLANATQGCQACNAGTVRLEQGLDDAAMTKAWAGHQAAVDRWLPANPWRRLRNATTSRKPAAHEAGGR